MTQPSLTQLGLQLVGCGNLGSALLERWLSAGLNPSHTHINVASHASVEALVHRFPALRGRVSHGSTRMEDADMLVLAVKPQQMAGIFPSFKGTQALVLTLAAGLEIITYQQALGEKARIVRAMPNTPVRVGAGVTTLVAGSLVTDQDKALVDALFRPTGAALWLEHEAQMPAATAVAGSGPAYVFFLEEILAQLAVEFGLPSTVVSTLVQQTLRGSLALEDASAGTPPSELRQQVTSKGGVTAAALEMLMDSKVGLKPLFKKAIEANIARNADLSSKP